MDYLINMPLLSYLVSYSNNKNKFRESKVLTINKSAAKAILKYQKKEKVDSFIKKIKSKKFNPKN